MAVNAAKKAGAKQKQRQPRTKRSAAGNAANKVAITEALTDAKRTAAAKWAWVTRQLKQSWR